MKQHAAIKLAEEYVRYEAGVEGEALTENEIKAREKAFIAGYNEGILKGSEIGDNTAQRFKEELNEFMSRTHNERVELVKERDENHRWANELMITNNRLKAALEANICSCSNCKNLMKKVLSR